MVHAPQRSNPVPAAVTPRSSTSAAAIAAEARDHVEQMKRLATWTAWKSDTQAIAGLAQLRPSDEAISFLWTPQGAPLRKELMVAFRAIAEAHPTAVQPGRATSAERTRWMSASPAELRREVRQLDAGMRAAGVSPPPIGDVDNLSKTALIDTLDRQMARYRAAPLGLQVVFHDIATAQHERRPTAEVSAMARRALARWDGPAYMMMEWLRTLARG